MSITIHTDGSCETQTRIGVYAAILQCVHHSREITGRAEDVTVNVMELKAVIEALNALKTARQTVQIFTGSNHVAKGVNEWMSDWITRRWKTARNKPIANADLRQASKANWLNRHQSNLMSTSVGVTSAIRRPH